MVRLATVRDPRLSPLPRGRAPDNLPPAVVGLALERERVAQRLRQLLEVRGCGPHAEEWGQLERVELSDRTPAAGGLGWHARHGGTLILGWHLNTRGQIGHIQDLQAWVILCQAPTRVIHVASRTMLADGMPDLVPP